MFLFPYIIINIPQMLGIVYSPSINGIVGVHVSARDFPGEEEVFAPRPGALVPKKRGYLHPHVNDQFVAVQNCDPGQVFVERGFRRAFEGIPVHIEQGVVAI